MPRIKICGLFRDEDVGYVNIVRPDYIGFVFAESRRRVTRETASKLRAKLRADIIPVGVFVNAPIDEIISLYRGGIICAAQLHGGEDEAYVRELKRRAGLLSIIKAIRVKTRRDIENIQTEADYILLDNGTGGTGQSFDWDLIGKPAKPYFLAGGIDIHNIDRAAALHPYAIDVSSGAEAGGVKDFDKIAALVLKIKGGM